MADEPDFKTGLFGNVGVEGSEGNPNTYAMTPKYNDPYTKSDSERKMAKILISTTLKNLIKQTLSIQNDPILETLGTGGNGTATDGRGYFDFFLQSVDESFDEKFQIVETLGDSYAIFGLGKKPRVINCSGVLLNSTENDWRVNFIKMFEKYVSVSSLAKFRDKGTKNIITMVYDSVTVRGAILNLRTSIQSANELVTSFSFQMVVTQSDAFNIKQLNFTKQTTNITSGVVKETNKSNVSLAEANEENPEYNLEETVIIKTRFEEESGPSGVFNLGTFNGT